MLYNPEWSSSNWVKRTYLAPLLLLAILLTNTNSTSAPALESLAQPTGRVILTVSGAIERTNMDGQADFDRAMLERLGTTDLATSTSWTDGVPEFKGVLVRDVLRAVGAHGTVVTATALNDYSLEIPIADFDNYQVLFALEMNGTELTARDKGPIWIVYPRDDHSELQDGIFDLKWVWQLAKIEIK